VGSEGAARVKEGYTTGARRLAARSIVGLGRTRITPDALTVVGLSVCAAAAVAVYFENRNELLWFWTGAILFWAGSLLDVLDGALARQSGKGTPFGAFLDSTTDRLGEAVMLGAIGLIFLRDGDEIALAATFAALTGSFLVSYTRARAEVLNLKGDIGIGSRAERVTVIVSGLFLAPWGLLPWAVFVLNVTAWLTVVQRIIHVRRQLKQY
jgi:CDP-diacylglycerol--glycerol-3-phosphate 3-phosphatidyltransferase